MGENDIDMKAIERDIHAQYTDALTQLQSDLDAVTAERDGLKSRVQPIIDLLEKHPGPWEAKYTGDMTPFLDGKRAHVKKDALLNAINAFAAGFEAGEVAGG